jgi:crotonobetainyl-CoA:carnitine CoA-transferase CaiB-like acyl-CoA transferase
VADELWQRMLGEVWAGLDREAVDDSGSRPVWSGRVEVTGEPGRLPSRLPVEDTSIACAGAALLAAAALHAGRGGGYLRVLRLDRAHVAAAFRSEAWLRVNGEPSGPGFAPLSRFWRTRDGWVRTHANYPWHREALVRALGTSDDPAAVAAAIAGRGACDVEDLVTGAEGVAAAVRTEAGWQAEPPGQAVAAAALIEGCLPRSATWDGVFSIGGAPPRRREAGALPASGIRVLDLTRVIAGPVATRFLAALGADVLRLDPPHRPELPQQTYDGLLGKRSALVDLGTPGGEARLHELLAGADVLVHGYRPHALDRFGLTPTALAERHPGLVVVSLSAWGSTGPWGSRRGFDSIVQAACGIAVTESPDGERPGALPCQLLDHGTGYLCAAAVLRALARQASGGGTLFRELSLARTGSWLMSQATSETENAAAAAADGDPGTWLTTVDSADGRVTVVRPLGRLDGPDLAWPPELTRYGGDAPAWW